MSRIGPALARARELLDRFILFDGHNDLPYTIRRAAGGDVKAYGLGRIHQESDTDIPRLREGQVGAQVFAAFVPTSVADPGRFTLEQIAVGLDIEEVHSDVFRPARRPSDIARARREGRIASMISVESAVGLGGSLSPLRVWHAAGVRILTLCHNETLDWIDSATDAPRHGGITDFGRAVVAASDWHREKNQKYRVRACGRACVRAGEDHATHPNLPALLRPFRTIPCQERDVSQKRFGAPTSVGA